MNMLVQPGSVRAAHVGTTRPARIHWMVCFLRFVAACQMLAFIAVFVPVKAWLAGWYTWLGLRPVPDVSAVLRYVIGATAFFQGAIGVWLWVMTSDVERYRPLLIATAVIYLVAAPVFYFIDAGAGLPLAWRIYDTAWCSAVGAAVGILCFWSLRDKLSDCPP
jgi:hypothetical protein